MSIRSSSLSRHFAVVLTVASIVIVIAIAVPSQAQADPEDMLEAVVEKRSRQTYCGSHLVDALHVACAGAYNGMYSKNKKNTGIPEDDLIRQQENDPEYWQKQSQDNSYELIPGLAADPGNSGWIPRPARFPFRERLHARAFLSHAHRRSIRGVHDECCAKSCSIQELRAYCAT